MMEFLRQNTAAVIVIALIDWADGKKMPVEILLSALKCGLYKNGVGQELTLSESGPNALVLSSTGQGMATLTLTAGNTDTGGRLKVVLSDTVTDGYDSEVVLRSIADFEVLTTDAYDALFGGGIWTVDLTAAALTNIEDGIAVMAEAGVNIYGTVWNKISEIWDRLFPSAELSETTTIPVSIPSSAQPGIESDMIELLASGEFSQAVAYTVSTTGVTKTINAVKMPTAEDYSIADVGSKADTIIVWYISANPDAGIETPAIKDTITDGSIVYEVLAVSLKDRVFAKLECKRIRIIKRVHTNQIATL